MGTPDSPQANGQPPAGDDPVGQSDPNKNRARAQRALESGDKNAQLSGRLFAAGIRGLTSGAARAMAEFLLDGFDLTRND